MLFRNLNLVDCVSPGVREGKAVRIEGERIAEVIDDHEGLSADNVIDLGGAFVTPGLIDAHVHLITPFVPVVTPGVIASLGRQVRRNLRTVLYDGVTTVRDVAGFPRRIQGARRAVNEGRVPGPRIVCANSYITCPGGTPEWIPYLRGPAKWIAGGQAVERVEGPEETAAAVRSMVELGADWVKTCHSDRGLCYGKGDPPTLSDESYEAFFAEAERLGKPVAFHQMWLSAFRKGLEYRPKTFDHTPMDGPLTDQDVSSFIEAGTTLIPTLDVYRDVFEFDRIAQDLEERGEEFLEPVPYRLVSEFLDKYRRNAFTRREIEKEWIQDESIPREGFPVAVENVRKIWQSGGAIGCGTDSGGAPFGFFGFFHRELQNLVDVGMSPFEALRRATVVNAGILGMEHDIGTIEAGKYADMVVVEGNPLEDISRMGRIRAVIKGGAVAYSREPLY
jgi:imidazolonepropionase-like amidohydrolase